MLLIFVATLKDGGDIHEPRFICHTSLRCDSPPHYLDHREPLLCPISTLPPVGEVYVWQLATSFKILY